MSVEPRMEAASSHSDTWPQTTPVDEKLMDAEQTLCDMSAILESARLTVADCRAENAASSKRCTQLMNAYNEEYRTRFECAQAYASLFAQHQTAMSDLQIMDDKCQFLHQELKTVQEAADCRDSEVQRRQQALEDKALSTESRNCGTNWDMLEHEIEKARLEAMVQELKNEKSEMITKHQTELANAADHIQDVTQKIRRLEEERDAPPGQVQLSASGQDGRETSNKVVLQKQTGQGNRGRKRRQAMKLNGIVKKEV